MYDVFAIAPARGVTCTSAIKWLMAVFAVLILLTRLNPLRLFFGLGLSELGLN